LFRHGKGPRTTERSCNALRCRTVCVPKAVLLSSPSRYYHGRMGDTTMGEKIPEAVASQLISAPPGQVWNALTDPTVIKKYFLGTEVTTSWRVGEPITFKGEWQGKHYEDKGVVLSHEPEHRLSISHYSPLTGLPDVPEN